MEPFIIFPIAIFIALVFRLIAGSMDGDRVADYIRRQGGVLIAKRWAPFGRGWFGEKSDRIYEVRYRDRDGNTHDATVKTSMFTGVYFTEDRIVQYAAARSELQPASRDLATENERLRRRIAELEGSNGSHYQSSFYYSE